MNVLSRIAKAIEDHAAELARHRLEVELHRIATDKLAHAVNVNTSSSVSIEFLTAEVARLAAAVEKLTADPPVPVRAEIRIGTRVHE